jgi:hypothetical protein
MRKLQQRWLTYVDFSCVHVPVSVDHKSHAIARVDSGHRLHKLSLGQRFLVVDTLHHVADAHACSVRRFPGKDVCEHHARSGPVDVLHAQEGSEAGEPRPCVLQER